MSKPKNERTAAARGRAYPESIDVRRPIVAKVQLVYKSEGAPYGCFWRLIARNGETLAHSETYATRRKAKQSAERVAAQLGVGVAEVEE